MKLDKLQKEQFMSYWGRCPLIDTTDNKMVTVEDVRVKNKNIVGIGYKWHISDVCGSDGVYPVAEQNYQINDLELLEPYFIDSGYYQLYNDTAYWVTRKTDRSIIKGMARTNTEIKYINRIHDKNRPILYGRKDLFIPDIVRIYEKKLYNWKSGPEVPERIHKFFMESRQNESICLSNNICLVASDFDVPVVFYKSIPVGYFFDKTIYIAKSREVSKETFLEESGLNVEVYEE